MAPAGAPPEPPPPVAPDRRIRSPVEWTAPSAWSDCGPTVYNVTLPYDPSTGITRVSLPLPPALVEGWLANNGSANYGLIMRWAPPTVFRACRLLRPAGLPPGRDLWERKKRQSGGRGVLGRSMHCGVLQGQAASAPGVSPFELSARSPPNPARI